MTENILRNDIPGAKRPSYSIVYDPEDITAFFSRITIEEKDGTSYLRALYMGKTPVCEKILPLDAMQFKNGEISLANLLAKYCSYLRKIG